MTQVLGSNLISIRAQNSLERSNSAMQVSLDRLASGNRINSSKDDAAGLAITNKFSSQIRGLEQATRNANDAISVAQISEGAMAEIGDILQRLREISVQAANGSNTSSDRTALNDEGDELKNEIDRISNSVDFNGTKLLNGELANKLFQIGYKSNDTVNMSVDDVRTTAIGSNKLDVINLANSIVNDNSGTLNGTNSAINSQSIKISGSSGSDILVASNASMSDIANSINSVTGTTGVSAKASNSIKISDLSHDGSVSFNLYGSNKAGSSSAVQITADATTSDLSNIRSAINNSSTSTGITADFVNGTDKTGLILSQQDGFDIGIEDYKNTASTDSSLRVDSYAATDIYRVELDGIHTDSWDGSNFVVKSGTSASVNYGTTPTLTVNNSEYTLSTQISADLLADEINDKLKGVDGITAGAYTEVHIKNWDDSIAHNLNFVIKDEVGINNPGAGSVAGSYKMSSADNAYGNSNSNTSIDEAAAYINSTVPDLSDFRVEKKGTDTLVLISEKGKNIIIVNSNSSGVSAGPLDIVNLSSGTELNGTVTLANQHDSVTLMGHTFIESDKSFTAEANGNLFNAASTENRTSTVNIRDKISTTSEFLTEVNDGTSNVRDSLSVRGKLELTSNKSFSISSDSSDIENSILNKTISAAESSHLNSLANVDLSTAENAQKAISTIDGAIQMLSSNRASLGSKQQRFMHAVNSMSKSIENVSAARSRVMDADYAKETAAMIKNQILQQAGVSVLAQANQMPKNILKLLY